MILFLFFWGCSSISKNNPHVSVINFQQPVEVIENNEIRKFNKGDKLEISKGQTFLVESPGHIGVLVVPLGKNVEANLRLKEISLDQLSPSMRKKQNIVISKILKDVIMAQNLLQGRKAFEALALVDKLITENGDLVYLNFLKASCHILLGQKEMARNSLDQALKIYPDFKDAVDLYGLVLSPGEKNPYLGNSL
jgi:tetratricopeptide (TPR) repeat protein